MTSVVIVYGPKAAGKSYLSQALERELGISHIDPDALVLEWIEQGHRPDPRNGWLTEIVAATKSALETHKAVSLEATGAWDSDWTLPGLLRDAGHEVITIRLLIDHATARARLSARQETRVPVSASEVERIWNAANARRKSQKVDLEIDAAGSDFVERTVRYLSERLRA
ncbi:MAG: AAA family ATPase [Proteobacteria bacterium]|nr:AAA family ATPase [Pseudomonadota bacterium]